MKVFVEVNQHGDESLVEALWRVAPRPSASVLVEELISRHDHPLMEIAKAMHTITKAAAKPIQRVVFNFSGDVPVVTLEPP